LVCLAFKEEGLRAVLPELSLSPSSFGSVDKDVEAIGEEFFLGRPRPRNGVGGTRDGAAASSRIPPTVDHDTPRVRLRLTRYSKVVNGACSSKYSTFATESPRALATEARDTCLWVRMAARGRMGAGTLF
jgi:hypothetical protein